MTAPWLTLLGIGEDGIAPAARALLANATWVAGGQRHLALTADAIPAEAERLPWPSPITDAFPLLLARRGQPGVVLASGDPFCFGIGTTLTRLIPMDEMAVHPAPSAFSLACARLGWALQHTVTLSFCGRPLETLRAHLHPGAKILALSAGAETPAQVKSLLQNWGFAKSRLRTLQSLGGPRETIAEGVPESPDALNLLAIEPQPDANARIIPRAPGLPDDWFEHDGQITKSEVRASTIAALAPMPGALLWDIGSGSGSVGIEWMLAHPACRAIAIERVPHRAARAAANALALGVPALRVETGSAPQALANLPAPHAIFIGGGARTPGLIDAAWTALPSGGRLVVNAVALETLATLADWHARFGGSMIRIAIERLDGIGALHGFRPAMAVTQWRVVKP